jgi:hypothetical protein
MKILAANPPGELAVEVRHHLADWLAEATVERDASLVRNVALLGPESRNGYRYTAEAMQAAVPLYEGRPVFVDHAEAALDARPSGCGYRSESEVRSPIRRSIRDYAGQVVNPRFENGRVRGDLRLAGPNTGWLLDLIEARPSDIGMSHVVLARRTPDGQAVEHIERVVSVDIVAFPATTRSFVESGPPGDADEPAPLTAEELRQLRALLLQRVSDRPVSLERSEPDRLGIPAVNRATSSVRAALLAAIRGS